MADAAGDCAQDGAEHVGGVGGMACSAVQPDKTGLARFYREDHRKQML
jgi:hypothetical protein